MALAPLRASRIVVHRDGELAVIVGRGRALVLSLADLSVIAALPLDEAAIEIDAVWLAERVLVSQTFAAHTRVHLYDVSGSAVRACSEKQIDSAFRVRGGGGTAALLLANNQAAVCTRHDDSLLIHPFASRAVPISVGAGSGVVVVGTLGAVEEWDLQTRTVRRRWKLAPSALPLAVGATERVIWFMAKHDPTRIEVIPLVNRGQPKVQPFGEAVVQVCSSAKADWVIGLAGNGHIHAVDLEGRVAPAQLPEIEGMTATVIGLAAARTTQLVAMDENSIAVVGLDANNRLIVQKQWRDIDAHAPVVRPAYQAPVGVTLAVSGPETVGSTNLATPASVAAVPSSGAVAALHAAMASAPEPVATAVAAAIALLSPGAASAPTSAAAASTAVASAAPVATPQVPVATPHVPVAFVPLVAGPMVAFAPAVATASVRVAPGAAVPTVSLTQRLDAWRARVKVDGRSNEGSGPLRFAARDNWRDPVSVFAKNPDVRAFERDGHVPARIVTLLKRLELDASLAMAVMLLYGSYLNGEAGVARVALAQILDGNWLEATGNGELQRRGMADFAGHLVTLPSAVQRFLDERAPQAGSLSRGASAQPAGRVAVDSPAVLVVTPLQASDPMALAQHCVDTLGGTWFAAAATDRATLLYAALEARLHDAGLVIAVADADTVQRVGYVDQLLLFAVTEGDLARQLGLPYAVPATPVTY